MTADRLFETTSIPGHLAPTPERLERLLSKQTLEELYEVEEQPFARGKYATVRRCRERSSGRQWAAKFLRKRRRAQELKAEALHEVAVLDAAAHCPHLVSLHQVFETNTEMVLVLELAPGGELQMVLDRDEVPEERQVVRLLRQILDGIAFLHSFNVAHLDIKPQNLVLTGEFPDCDVKLCDFGISRYISHGADIREILGTPDYVAPEVLNYESISLATDMWSVGVLLYVLLTGCSPFGGDTKQETFCNISRCRLDFPDDLFEDVSEDARDLMRKLMVKDPSKRLTVTECLQHPWFALCISPEMPLTLTTSENVDSNIERSMSPTLPILPELLVSPERTSTPEPEATIEKITPAELNGSEELDSSITEKSQLSELKPTTTTTTSTKLSQTTTIYTKRPSPSMPLRIGLSPDRRDTFKRNMDSLAQKFSSGAEIVIIEQAVNTQRRAIGNHTMPAGEVFKCTPVFILGEEQQCSDSSSDTFSEISTDGSSDRSSIYSDDSLDCNDRWDHKNSRPWPRECTGVRRKALSCFITESTNGKTSKATVSASSSRAKTGLEALRERGGNYVVIREPVKAGRYTRYSEVQCESVQARIRRFQVHGST